MFDGIAAATTATVDSAKNLIDSGPATALSVGSSITGALGALLNGSASPKLPMPNPLSAYPTYNYVLGLGVLTDNQLNFPDATYMAGKPITLICKDANADPMNRIKTAYGQFDFFIDNLVLSSQIGHEKNNNTNVTGVSFDVTEPYSMGMFLIALQTAAYQAGHKYYRDAPFLLTIQFRGNNSKGTLDLIPNTTRYIPIKFTTFDMKVTEKGAVYGCKAMPYNVQALSTKNSNLKSDASIKGKTVQEMLQTGEKSLQAVLNKRLEQLKKDGVVEIPDQVLIIFPEEIASSASAPAAGSAENTLGATAAPAAPAGASGGAGALYQKLGVSISKINQTLVQPEGKCNALGKAKMGFSIERKGETPSGKDNQVWDEQAKTYIRGNNTINFEESDFKFTQESDIPNAINQVLLASSFPTETLDQSKISAEGMKGWWKIDTAVYNVSAEEQQGTGVKPKLIVYRVIPYEVHSSNQMPPNAKAPGFEELKKQAVKVYNYIYTGANTEVISFNIEFKASFTATFAADNFKRTADAKLAAQQGASNKTEDTNLAVAKGDPFPSKAGVTNTQASYNVTTTSTDGKGGGGLETEDTRAARLFHDAINKGKDMMNLSMDIMGDPYFIAQSGQGNYTSKPTQKKNLNADGTVNWQNGEVDIVVNFRSPIDLMPSTGLYKFSGGKSAPVLQFSGLYRVTIVQSKFSGGKFTQTLTGYRRPAQESPVLADPAKTTTTSNKKPETKSDKAEQ